MTYGTLARFQVAGEACARLMDRFSWNRMPLMFGMLGMTFGYFLCLCVLVKIIVSEPVFIVRDRLLAW